MTDERVRYLERLAARMIEAIEQLEADGGDLPEESAELREGVISQFRVALAEVERALAEHLIAPPPPPEAGAVED